MLRFVAFVFSLLVLWLVLSGHFSGLMISFGLASCLLVAFLAQKLQLIDEEGFPIQLSYRILLYIPWLMFKIIQANIHVCRQILSPRLKLEPIMFSVPCSQKTDLGKVIYANSITLTPGTLSLSINNNQIEIHALTQSAEEDLKTGEMDRRVTRVMGEK